MIEYLKTAWRVRSAQGALAELVTPVWVADAKYLDAMFEHMRVQLPTITNADIKEARARSRDVESESARPGLNVERGVARIPIAGPIMREVPCIFDLFGIEATSTRHTQGLIREALADDEVKSILLEIDSPGGTVDGTSALADEIFSARSVKPVHAHAAGMAASAAYWLGAQATRFTSEETSAIGSIGVYSVIRDLSVAAAQEGVKVHVVKTGPHKGAGIPGSEVTPAMLAVDQEIVDRVGSMFKAAILRGRSAQLTAEQINAYATGRVWLGADAVGLGLIDATESIESALNAAHQINREPDSHEGNMSSNQTTPAASGTQSNTEIERLNAELAAERAKNTRLEGEKALAETSLKAAREQALADVIDRHAKAGRIAPSSRADVENIAAKAYADDPKGLDAYLAKLPVVVKSKPAVGANELPEEPNVETAEAQANAAIYAQAAKAFNTTAERARLADTKVAGISANGKPVDSDGNVVAMPPHSAA